MKKIIGLILVAVMMLMFVSGVFAAPPPQAINNAQACDHIPPPVLNIASPESVISSCPGFG